MTTRTRILLLLAAAGIVAAVGWHLARSAGEALTVFEEIASSSPSGGKPATLAAKPELARDADPAGEDLVPLGDVPAGGFGVIAHVFTEEKPAAGVVVRMRMEAPEATGVAPLTATTDAAGEARFGPMPAPRVPRRLWSRAVLVVEVDGETKWRDRYHRVATSIDAEMLEGRVSEYSPVTVEVDKASNVLWLKVGLDRPAGLPVSGRVTTANGVGIPGARIYEGNDVHLGQGTDEDGEFWFRVPSPGRKSYRVALRLWGEREPLLSPEVDVPAPAGVAGLHWVLPGVETIEGRALERDGRPASEAEICLTRAGEDVSDAVGYHSASSEWEAPNYLLRLLTRADGTFRFVGALTGKTYDVRWWESQDEDRVGAAGVASGARGIEFRLDRHGVLPRLVDAEGRAVHGDISYRRRDSDDEVELRGSFSPDQDGLLSPPGSKVAIHAQARGYSDVFLEHTVSDRPGLDAVEVRMRASTSPRAVVRIRCADAAGAPLPWPVVRWTQEPTGVVVDLPQRIEDGAFVTTGLDAGAYRVRVWDSYGLVYSPEHAGLPRSGALRFVTESELRVEVPAMGTRDLTWTLPTGGAMSVTFRDAKGAVVEPGDMYAVWAQGAAGKPVWVRFTDERRNRAAPGDAEQPSQALPAGEYVVTWYRHGGRGAPPPPTARLASARVTVSVGMTTSVELQAPAGER